MDYKSILEPDEKVLFATRIHAYVLIFPLVFTGTFGMVFTYGSMMTGEFVEICQIMSYTLMMYPLIIGLMIINSKFVITDKRVIEQGGILNKRHRSIPIPDITDIASHQTKLRKLIRCGDIRIKAGEGKKEYFRIFRYVLYPHEFIVHLNDVVGNKPNV